MRNVRVQVGAFAALEAVCVPRFRVCCLVQKSSREAKPSRRSSDDMGYSLNALKGAI